MRSIRRSAALVALVAGALTFTAGGASAAGWLEPESVSLSASDLGFDRQGNAVAVGIGADPNGERAVTATTRPFGGSWSAPVLVAGSGDSNASAPKVAVDADGDAIAVWAVFSGSSGTQVIRVSSRLAGGVWTPPSQLSSGPASFGADYAVAVDGEGVATVAWAEFNGTTNVMRSATAPIAGDWVAAALVADDLSDNGHGYAVTPQLAVDPQGNTTAVWASGSIKKVHAKRRPAGGPWAPVAEVLSGDGAAASAPRVAVDTQGNATVVWESSFGGDYTVQAARFLGNAWHGPESLGQGSTPQVTIDAHGHATAVWLSNAPATPVVASSRSDAGETSWSAAEPVAVSSDAGNVSTPWVEADPQGNVTALWARGSVLGDLTAESARRVSGSASWSPAGAVEVGSVTAIPAAGVDPQGHATIAWSDSQLFFGPWSGSSSILDPIAPELRDLTVPATGVVGQPVSLSVTPFDISSVATAWDFGDGQSGSGASTSHVFSSPGERTVTVTGVDAAGNATAATRAITVVAAPGPGPDPDPKPTPDPVPDPIPDPGPGLGPGPIGAPTLSGLQQTSARWTAVKRRGSRAPVGTSFRFRLNRSAQVRLSFEQVVTGRRAGKQCTKATKKNRKKRACRRYEKRGSVSVAGKAGVNRVEFRGRVGGRTPEPGRYRVQVTATADGKTSKAATKTFTIAR